MEMHITKNTAKAHVILYKRNNGTQTWMPANDFLCGTISVIMQ